MLRCVLNDYYIHGVTYRRARRGNRQDRDTLVQVSQHDLASMTGGCLAVAMERCRLSINPA